MSTCFRREVQNFSLVFLWHCCSNVLGQQSLLYSTPSARYSLSNPQTYILGCQKKIGTTLFFCCWKCLARPRSPFAPLRRRPRRPLHLPVRHHRKGAQGAYAAQGGAGEVSPPSSPGVSVVVRLIKTVCGTPFATKPVALANRASLGDLQTCRFQLRDWVKGNVVEN